MFPTNSNLYSKSVKIVFLPKFSELNDLIFLVMDIHVLRRGNQNNF